MDWVCGLCREELMSPKALPCRHEYCLMCVKGLILEHYFLLCPSCRQRIPESFVKKLEEEVGSLRLVTVEYQYNSELLQEIRIRLREKRWELMEEVHKFEEERSMENLQRMRRLRKRGKWPPARQKTSEEPHPWQFEWFLQIALSILLTSSFNLALKRYHLNLKYQLNPLIHTFIHVYIIRCYLLHKTPKWESYDGKKCLEMFDNIAICIMLYDIMLMLYIGVVGVGINLVFVFPIVGVVSFCCYKCHMLGISFSKLLGISALYFLVYLYFYK